MVKPQIVNASNTGAKSTKTNSRKPKSATEGAVPSPSPVPHRPGKNGPQCAGCCVIVGPNIRALQCDQCGDVNNVWKCANCLGVSDELYSLLMDGGGAELQWICDTCKNENTRFRQANVIDDKIQGLAEQLDKVQTIVSAFAEQLHQSRSDMSQWQEKMELLFDQKLTFSQNTVQSVEKLKNEVGVQLQEFKKQDKLDAMTVKDCVQQAIDVKSQEEKDEEAERLKRKTSIIIHGLPESAETQEKDRQDDDIHQVAAIFNELECDEVRIVKLFRLGKKSDDVRTSNSENTDADQPVKPRPLKAVLETEDQKSHVLLSAKNLRRKKRN